MICAIVLQFAHFARAQTSVWDSGVPKDLFKDDLTPPDKKNPKKPQKPVHRLAPTTCDDCQKIVDQLQNALDDWSALELADANDTIKKSVAGEKTDVSQADARAQKEDALAGLGQKERPPPKGKSKADVKKEIKKLSDALQECLKKCAETPTPTPTPTPGEKPPDDGKQPGTGKGDGGLKLPTLPTLPPCWQTPDQKKKFFEDLDAAEKELLRLRKKNMPEGGGKIDEEAVPKINAEFKKLNELKEKAPDIKDCGHGMAPGQPTGGTYVCFSGTGTSVAIIGTGETIGHVADVRIDNLTDQPINCSVPPMVLESGSGKNQDYVIPHGQDVALRPHESKTIPMDGVCVNRHKPPVGKGIGGDLVMSDPGGNVPRDSHSHLKHGDADKLLRLCTAKYDAVDKLQKDGALKDLPYRDKEKQKDICVQWSTWTDPRVSEIEGGNPATKDDLKKVVYKQVEEHGPVTPDKKKKIDQGIDTIFDKIELTNEKAKDLEKPEGETVEETPPIGGPEYVGQGHTYAKQPTPTPAPKPKGGGSKTKEKPTPTPTPTPTPEPKEEGAVREDDPGRGETEEIELPKPKYQYKKEIDCGTIIIDVGTKGDLIFEFKPNDKCPCKEFGWVQHVAPEGYNSWNYDNNAKGSAGKGGKGAPSDPNKPNQPTQPPKGKKLENWGNNPWYGGTTDPTKNPEKFAGHPTPQTKISDRPTLHNQKFRTQLVCVTTGEVYFTWAWGPVAGEDTALDSVGAKEVPPPESSAKKK